MLQPLPENAYIKTMQLDGAPSSDGEIDLSRGARGSRLRLVVSANGAQISGAVLDKDGARFMKHDGGNPPPQ